MNEHKNVLKENKMKNNIINYNKIAEEWFKLKYPTLSQNELLTACAMCQAYQLNPIRNEIYFIKYANNTPAQLVVNYQVILAKAMQDPRIFRWAIEYWQNGKRLEHPHLTPDMEGVVVSVKIYDHDGNLISDVDWDVSDNAKSNSGHYKSTNFNSWVQKCALTNAFRRTSPNYVAGLYIEDEFPVVPSASGEATEGKTNPKKASVSPLYRNIIDLMKTKGLDKKAQIKLLEDYQTQNNKTHEDLINGNFDASELVAFVDAHHEEQDDGTNDEVH